MPLLRPTSPAPRMTAEQMAKQKSRKFDITERYQSS